MHVEKFSCNVMVTMQMLHGVEANIAISLWVVQTVRQRLRSATLMSVSNISYEMSRVEGRQKRQSHYC